jgi:hypothetical protein
MLTALHHSALLRLWILIVHLDDMGLRAAAQPVHRLPPCAHDTKPRPSSASPGAAV